MRRGRGGRLWGRAGTPEEKGWPAAHAEEVKRQTACKPCSVPRVAPHGWPFIWDARCRAPRAIDPDGGAKTRVAAFRRTGRPSLLDLAPGGVCRAAPVAGRAVRSYRTLRSEERRVGQECVSTCRSRGAPYQ